MHLKKLNKTSILILLFILPFSLIAQEKQVLSQDRLNLFELEQKKAKEDSSKLRKDWINPIEYQFRKNFGETYENEKSIISINQPIFKSGGIYETIKYANSTYSYSSLEILQQKKQLITKALNYLFLIKRTDLYLQRAKLSVLNAKIDVNRKKEQVLNGFLDSSFLDNAILTLNSAKHSIIDLRYQKREYINNFHNLSSEHYTKFELPKLKLYSKKEFLDRNLELQKATTDITKKDNFAYITISKYLPSVNAFYNYSKDHYTDGHPALQKGSDTNFGIAISVPLDSRSLNDIQSKKIDYLKAKLSLKNKIKDEESFFKNKMYKISILDEKIAITNEDLATYKSILNIIEEEKEAQLKTQSDVDTLKNSQKIKYLDLKLIEIEKQIELLELYSKLN